jgi:DNA-binding NtrC family response regulator
MISAGTLRRGALLVSEDQALAEQVRGFLEEDARFSLEMAASYDQARQLLELRRPHAVMIDLRRSSAVENPTPLLHKLAEGGAPRIPVIAISETGYVCDWAAVADLIVSGHVQLPLNRQELARLLGSALDGPQSPFCAGSLSPRVYRGKTVTFKTQTPALFPLLEELTTMAAHDVTVLLVGETGTGKTTLARLIHELSSRQESKLLTVACGALPPDLIESELFGHVKGAFTSAGQTRQGKFEAARDGTLLLDEIDVLGPAQQAKLLRVIETGEFEPVGSNVDLRQLMDHNTFRADLYYRLSVLELRIPPLRERPQDIVPLALDFVDECCAAHHVLIRRVHPDFLACLKNYQWPGNVRELKNHVRRAVLFCRSGILTPSELSPRFQGNLAEAAGGCNSAGHLLAPAATPMSGSPATSVLAPAATPALASPATPGVVGSGRPWATTLVEKMASSEREALEQALKAHNYNRTATAIALGLSRVGLYKKMKKHGLLDLRAR